MRGCVCKQVLTGGGGGAEKAMCTLAHTPVVHTNVCAEIYAACIHYIRWVGQNLKYSPYMTVYLVISLPKLPYIHRIYMVLANPIHMRYFEQGNRHSYNHARCIYIRFWPTLLWVMCVRNPCRDNIYVHTQRRRLVVS